MKEIGLIYIVVFFMLSVSGLKGQTTPGSLDQGSIASQYDFMLSKSNNYQQYKVVRKDFLTKFYGNISDSLDVYGGEISKLNSTIYLKQNNEDSLKSQLMILNRDLEKVNKEKNSFSLFGILLGKTVYNTLMWTIILGLLSALIFFIYRFRMSHVITIKAKDSLVKTKGEFDAFKKKTLEKEQKLMRKLQDELNKNQMNMG